MLSQDLRSSTPPSKSPESLKAELRGVNKELTLMKRQWQEEKRRLLGDKAVLQDTANKLNAQMRDAERRAKEKEGTVERVRGLQACPRHLILTFDCRSSKTRGGPSPSLRTSFKASATGCGR
jgi:hypothetical protein